MGTGNVPGSAEPVARTFCSTTGHPSLSLGIPQQGFVPQGAQHIPLPSQLCGKGEAFSPPACRVSYTPHSLLHVVLGPMLEAGLRLPGDFTGCLLPRSHCQDFWSCLVPLAPSQTPTFLAVRISVDLAH